MDAFQKKIISLLSLLPLAASAVEIESTFVATGLLDPMEVAPAPNGDLIVIEREGRVLRVRPTTGGVFEMGTLPVTSLRATAPQSESSREDGLLGLALDPNFAKNHRIYLYFSHPEKSMNRLARFEIKDGLLDLASEKVLLDIPTEREKKVCHPGGSIEFGPDGLLYLTTGDNTNPFESSGYAPIDDRDGRTEMNAMRTAGNTNDLRGKVLRIRPTEDGYEIPAGNLFKPGTPKTRPEIYVMGCRNPFRLSIDPKNSVIYWGEVGPDAGGDSNRGARGHDEVNQAKQAGNFGWPFVIANNKPYAMVDFSNGQVGPVVDPAAPKNPSKLNTGLTDLPAAQSAFIWYPYAGSAEFPAMGSGGRNAMAGPVFYHDSNRPYNILSKEEDHSLLTYDWMRGNMWKAKLGAEEKLEKLELLTGGLMHPMDLEMTSDGTLWLLEYGSGWYFNKDGRVRRMRLSNGNKAPTVTISANGNTYNAAVADPDGDTVTIDWWVTTGATEKKVGTGLTVTLDAVTGTELRAVATDTKGGLAIARQSIAQKAADKQLVLELEGKPTTLSFGQSVAFVVKGAAEPKDVIVRARFVPKTGHDAGSPQLDPEVMKVLTARQCTACHQVDATSVGPSYVNVALKYRGDAAALKRLHGVVKAGSTGTWGNVAMPPQVAVTDAELDTILKSVLGLADGVSEVKGAANGKLDLPPVPATPLGEGSWEITATAVGKDPVAVKIPAK